MKIAALVTAAALACGATYANAAADTSKSADKAPTAQTEPQGEGFAVKTKRAFKRMGDKLRSIGNKDNTQQAKKGDDTRAMGAGPAPEDAARRERMDSAYSSYKGKDKDRQQK
jgi:hypothetical protein